MEKDGVWSEDFKITAFMVDKDRDANLATIQNICQELARNQADLHNLGYENMEARGMAWVLIRLKIDVYQFPKWMETVNAKAWVSQMQPFVHRHFQITTSEADPNTVIKGASDTNGDKILANIYTIWVPIDTTTKKPKRMPDYDLPLKEVMYDCDVAPKLPKIVDKNADTEGVVFSSERDVQFSDLDMQSHVNNAKYTEWLLDDFFRDNKEDKPKSLEINFLGEVLQGEKVQFYKQILEEKTIYAMRNKADGKEVCRAKLAYEIDK